MINQLRDINLDVSATYNYYCKLVLICHVICMYVSPPCHNTLSIYTSCPVEVLVIIIIFIFLTGCEITLGSSEKTISHEKKNHCKSVHSRNLQFRIITYQKGGSFTHYYSSTHRHWRCIYYLNCKCVVPSLECGHLWLIHDESVVHSWQPCSVPLSPQLDRSFGRETL